MASRLIVQSSPHLQDTLTTQKIMLYVLLALAPAGIFSVVLFGVHALMLIAVCAASCVAFEYLFEKLTRRPVTVGDFSAVVTGVLLAYNLPPAFPVWMAVIGCFVAIVVIKQLFGGIGQNFVNPAIAGRVFLLISFAGPMTNWLVPTYDAAGNLDLAAGATPLSQVSQATIGARINYLPLLGGLTGGSLGEVSAILLLLGGVFLVLKGIIQPVIPVAYLATVALLSAVCGYDPLFQLLSGGLMLGAIFMATDYVTTPATRMGKLIFAIGCGVITVGIRLFGSYPEGVSFAILLMNLVTPLIDRFCVTHPFGAKKPEKAKKGGDAA